MRAPASSLGSTLLVLVGLLAAPAALAAPPAPRLVLYVDRDDDDVNGVSDGEQALVPEGPELALLSRPSKLAAGVSFAIRGASARLLADGKPLAPGALVPARGALRLQALAPGRGEIDLFGTTFPLAALEVRALDGAGDEVSLVRSRASLERLPPERLADDPLLPSADPDALRFVIIGHGDDLPGTVTLTSISSVGARIDALSDVSLASVVCPPGVAAGLSCGSTVPIRAVIDDIDRNHPLVIGRSIKAELGGAIAVATARGDKLQMIRVGGPRKTAIGAIDRFRARLRLLLVRLAPHGPAPLGGDDLGALRIARAEVARANLMWGACGVSFGPLDELDAAVVDPPKPHLLAMGCDHGLPASGGVVRFRVDGREISARIAPGMRPEAAARVVVQAVTAAGFTARVSQNPVIGAGAFGSADVLVRTKRGELVSIDPPASGPLSGDATMSVCIGRVDLDDGLQHFSDIDAIAGTVEERALIKAFDDGDPATIEVFFIPSFAGGGRIGESFIAADGGTLRNLLIEDRAGVRADRSSFALAHELGHILLDEPGHPDDFGADTPTRLMDADAANSSAYGPRRLLVDECVRALRQSGPSAPVAMLRPWPLGVLGAAAGKAKRK